MLVQWIGQEPLPEGVDFVAVATSVDPSRENYPPAAWFDREGWPFRVLNDEADGSIGAAFGMTSFPYFVVVGDDGVVRARVGGNQTQESFEGLVDLAAGQI